MIGLVVTIAWVGTDMVAGEGEVVPSLAEPGKGVLGFEGAFWIGRVDFFSGNFKRGRGINNCCWVAEGCPVLSL